MPKLGAYSKEIVLARPDGRSREARLLKQMRRRLTEHLGGEGRMTAPQRALVERAAMLQLRCAVLDQRVVDGSFTEYDAKTYLAFSNSLSRTLGRLGLEPAADPLDRAPPAAPRWTRPAGSNTSSWIPRCARPTRSRGRRPRSSWSTGGVEPHRRPRGSPTLECPLAHPQTPCKARRADGIGAAIPT